MLMALPKNGAGVEETYPRSFPGRVTGNSHRARHLPGRVERGGHYTGERTRAFLV